MLRRPGLPTRRDATASRRAPPRGRGLGGRARYADRSRAPSGRTRAPRPWTQVSSVVLDSGALIPLAAIEDRESLHGGAPRNRDEENRLAARSTDPVVQ